MFIELNACTLADFEAIDREKRKKGDNSATTYEEACKPTLIRLEEIVIARGAGIPMDEISVVKLKSGEVWSAMIRYDVLLTMMKQGEKVIRSNINNK